MQTDLLLKLVPVHGLSSKMYLLCRLTGTHIQVFEHEEVCASAHRALPQKIFPMKGLKPSLARGQG